MQLATYINLQNDTKPQAKRAKMSTEAAPATQAAATIFARVEAPATASPVVILVSFSDDQVAYTEYKPRYAKKETVCLRPAISARTNAGTFNCGQ